MEFLQKIIRVIADLLDRSQYLERIRKKIINQMTSEKMDCMLSLLLEAMKVLFMVDREFRSNIKGLIATYSFRTADGKMGVSAVFTRGILPGSTKMKVADHFMEDSDVNLTFKDGRSLCELLLSDSPDIFNGILDNKLSYAGNLSYLLKFVYMSRHIAYTFGLAV